jgi:hypothetical protein
MMIRHSTELIVYGEEVRFVCCCKRALLSLWCNAAAAAVELSWQLQLSSVELKTHSGARHVVITQHPCTAVVVLVMDAVEVSALVDVEDL